MISGSVQLRILALAAFVLVVSPAWSTPESVDTYYEDAKERMAAGDLAGAMIQLKNARRLDPEHLPSLILTGDIYMAEMQPAAAAHAYSAALLSGAETGPTSLKLAEAYIVGGQFSKLITELPADALHGAAQAELLGYRARAYIALQQYQQAEAALEQAHSIAADATEPARARITLLIRDGDLEQAAGMAREIVDRAPGDANGWFALASVQRAQHQNDAAIDSYKRAIELQPYLPEARLALADLLVMDNRESEAVEQIEFLRNYYPREPRAAYLQAALRERSGDAAGAVEAYRACANILSGLSYDFIVSNGRLTVEAVISHLRLGEDEVARQYLEAYYNRHSDNPAVGKVLAKVMLDMKDHEGALDIIAPLLAQNPTDPELLRMQSQSYKLAGRYADAAAVMRKVTTTDAAGLDYESKLAVAQINEGDIESGIRGLERVIAEDPLRQAEMFTLSRAYLSVGNHARSMELAGQLLAEDPAHLGYANLLAVGQMSSGDLSAAADTLSRALESAPENRPTRINLVRVRILQKDFSAGREALNELAEDHPDDTDIMLLYARLEQRAGNLPEARRWGEKTLQRSPKWIEPRYFLTKLYLQMNEGALAEKLARKVAANEKASLDDKFLLAEVLTATGQEEKALAAYRTLTRKAGFDTPQLYRIAERQVRRGAYSDASYTLFKAVEGDPDHLPARAAYAEVYISMKEYAQALELTKELIKDWPEEAVAHELEARALFGLEAYPEATASFARAAALSGGEPRHIAGQYRSLQSQGETEAAEALIGAALAKAPEDTVLNSVRVADLMHAGRWREAEKTLAILLRSQPDNPLLLNNMAFSLSQQGHHEQALPFARRAHELSPTTPQINDTFGWVLIQLDRPEEGVNHLRRAVAAAAGESVMHYHLGIGLHRLGDEAAARRHLALALDGGEDFDGRATAEELMKSL